MGKKYYKEELITKTVVCSIDCFWHIKKYCLTIDKIGFIEEHKTSKGFTNVSENLNRTLSFKMLNGDELIAEVLLSWKHSFDNGVIKTHEQRFCSGCKK